jgi:hypothetical protein
MENDRKALKSISEIKSFSDPEKSEAISNAIHNLEKPDPYPRGKKKYYQGPKILVIPDSHAKVGVQNHRYEWLGRMVTDLKPDYIVDIGDWFDMHSLNGYDKPGSKSFRGASYWRDIEVGLDARLRFQNQIDIYNRGRKKDSRYSPELIFCVGNHENRINKFVEEEPRFEGIISLDDLKSKELGWEQIPFLDVKEIEGCSFSHYFTSGVMGRPISGLHQASSLLTKRFQTCIQGHTHTYDHSVKSTATKHIHGLVVGCYFEHKEPWAGPANLMWRRGVCVLNDVRNGDFDLEFWGIDRIKAKYS